MKMLKLVVPHLPPVVTTVERAYACYVACFGMETEELKSGVLHAYKTLLEAQSASVRAISQVAHVKRNWPNDSELYEAAIRVAHEAMQAVEEASSRLLSIVSSEEVVFPKE